MLADDFTEEEIKNELKDFVLECARPLIEELRQDLTYGESVYSNAEQNGAWRAHMQTIWFCLDKMGLSTKDKEGVTLLIQKAIDRVL